MNGWRKGVPKGRVVKKLKKNRHEHQRFYVDMRTIKLHNLPNRAEPEQQYPSYPMENNSITADPKENNSIRHDPIKNNSLRIHPNIKNDSRKTMRVHG
jgi:hypothetical protein